MALTRGLRLLGAVALVLGLMFGALPTAAAPAPKLVTLGANPATVPFGSTTTTINYTSNQGTVYIFVQPQNSACAGPLDAGVSNANLMANFIQSGSYIFTARSTSDCNSGANILASVTVLKANPLGVPAAPGIAIQKNSAAPAAAVSNTITPASTFPQGNSSANGGMETVYFDSGNNSAISVYAQFLVKGAPVLILIGTAAFGQFAWPYQQNLQTFFALIPPNSSKGVASALFFLTPIGFVANYSALSTTYTAPTPLTAGVPLSGNFVETDGYPVQVCVGLIPATGTQASSVNAFNANGSTAITPFATPGTTYGIVFLELRGVTTGSPANCGIFDNTGAYMAPSNNAQGQVPVSALFYVT